MRLNPTHNPKRRSWIESANAEGCEFPIQNLPFGVFRRKGSDEAPRGGVAIGDAIVDVAAFAKAARLRGAAREAARGCAGPTLNPLLELGGAHWSALRHALSRALSLGEAGWEARKAKLSEHLVPMARGRAAAAGRDRRLHRLLHLASSTRPTSAGCSAPTTR